MALPLVRSLTALALLGGACAGSLTAADQAPAPTPPPADTLQQQVDALRKQLGELQTQVQQTNEATAALGQSVGKLEGEANVEGSFAWGGLIDVSVTTQHKSQDPAVQREAGRTVGVVFAPILTYSWKDDWLAVAEIQGTTSALTLSQGFISNTQLEHVVFSAGLMPLPFAAYSERFSPAWINKCGESLPLPYNGDLGLFTSDIGDYQVQARGDVALGDNRRLTWHAFLAQGPTYHATDGSDDRLDFGGNTGPGHRAPCVGGRVGYLPRPGVEVGVSAMAGGLTYSASNNVPDPATGVPYGPDDRRRFLAYAVDGEWRVAGCILRGEWVGLRYDASDDSRLKARSFYLQASKRLREFGEAWANVEPVVRVGHLDRNKPLDYVSGSNEYDHVQNYGVGVNYYHTSYIRSSLFAEGFNGEAHNLDQIVLNTTFAF